MVLFIMTPATNLASSVGMMIEILIKSYFNTESETVH